jgi:hypothetical protein
MISPGWRDRTDASAGMDLGSAPLAWPEEWIDASGEDVHAPCARDSAVKLEGKVATREIARRIGVAPSTVRLTIERFQAEGLTWPLGEEVNDAQLRGGSKSSREGDLGPRKCAASASTRAR